MIDFQNVSKIYKNLIALEDVTFKIDEGEFLFLVGPSGSGKTTVIKLLIKEEDPTEGKIFFYDTDVTEIKGSKIDQLRREIGVVFQDFKLLEHKNLYENIAFTLEVAGRKKQDIEETVPYVLDLIDLEDRADAFPHEISGGEKQKVAIGRAIANNPKVLIADEPTGNLDPDATKDISELLLKINEWGTTVIMATHGSDIVDEMNKRVIQLKEGRITSDTKEGLYPKSDVPIIPIDTRKDLGKLSKAEDGEKKQEKGKESGKKKKEKTPKKAKKDEKIKPKSKLKPKAKKASPEHKETKPQEIEEQEFEISFTTKGDIPKPLKKTKSKKKKSQKRKGKDVVDIHKLNLPSKVEKVLISKGIKTIKKLKETSREKFEGISDLKKEDIDRIQKTVKK